MMSNRFAALGAHAPRSDIVSEQPLKDIVGRRFVYIGVHRGLHGRPEGILVTSQVCRIICLEAELRQNPRSQQRINGCSMAFHPWPCAPDVQSHRHIAPLVNQWYPHAQPVRRPMS
jgi:hypothetical protein